jgi:hypothetical protein
MDLPDQKGTYILIAVLLEMKRLKIGRLETYDVIPGFPGQKPPSITRRETKMIPLKRPLMMP